MTIAVIRFPGTNNENDVLRALSLIPGGDPYLVTNRQGSEALKDADVMLETKERKQLLDAVSWTNGSSEPVVKKVLN